MPRTGQPSQEPVASLSRALKLLDALADSGELGTNELARRLSATPSTISRQLGALVEARLVEHLPATGRYRLGIRLVELANTVLARLDVRAVARPRLEALVETLEETATLSVAGEPDAITVDFVPTRRYIQSAERVGRPSVAHATAAGKVMLAYSGRRPRPPLAAYTERTVVDPAALEHELERVQARGWADAYGEREPALNAIAAPIRSSDGGLAGILGIQGPAPRFGRAQARAALPALLEHAAGISAELGFSEAPDRPPRP